LHAEYVHKAIVDSLPPSTTERPLRIVEIGAGLGTLTSRLLATGADVWAIERDRDLCIVLRQEFAGAPNLRVHEADAVRFDYGDAFEANRPLPVIVGNLPYHLTGPLLFALLNHHERTGPWIVMIQKEVGDRLCAPPGSRVYGGPTVALSRQRAIKKVIDVAPGAFVPPPAVDSVVLRLDPLPQPRGEVADPQGFLMLVQAAFQRRRKTIVNALSALAPREVVQRWCEELQIPIKARPEQLTVEQFAGLQRARETTAEAHR
jgi:16S rRNA (adenine1518-N6/adenine1519-N6)-dimethyltransferase